jgi:single-strand DNA-binding protein
VRDTNQVTIVGRLVRDTDSKELNGGNRVNNFTVASNYNKKVGDSWEEMVSFIDCESFRVPEGLEPYLTKGKQVVVTGMLRQDRWEDENGNKRSKLKVLADNLQLIGSKNDSESSDHQQPAEKKSPATQTTLSNDDGFNDDIPF